MNDLIVSFISLIGTAAGAITGIIVSNRISIYRIEQLEKKLDKYADSVDKFIVRLTALEEKVLALVSRVEALERRVDD